MALRFASAAAVGFPAAVSIWARMLQLFHGWDAWPNWRLAFDRPQDLLPHFVEATELAQRVCEVVPYDAFSRRVNRLVHGLPEEGGGFLQAVEGSLYKIPS